MLIMPDLPTPSQPPALLSRQDRIQITAAWAGWAVLTLVMVVLVIIDPVNRSVTPNYRIASDAFWNRTEMYLPGQHGWLYLPNSALLYTPFTFGPVWLGEAVFRVVIAGLFAWGLWKVAVLASPRRAGDYFPLMTLLAIPITAGSIRNGQMNVPLGACMALSAVAMAGARTWPAAAWLALGVLTKPTGIVMPMLLGALRPGLLPKLIPLLVVVFALPLVRGDVGYAIELYRKGFEKMVEAARPGAGTFADLTGMLSTVGIESSHTVMTLVRAAAALATLVLAWLALRRWPVADAWIIVLGLACSYLMLFNPRTEGVGYPILMPPLTAITCWMLFRDRRLVVGGLLTGLGVLMGVAHVFSPGGGGDVFLRPLGTIAFLALLIVMVLTGWPRGRFVQPAHPVGR
jgi:alpha-1,2-mannosyltransferase